MSPFLAPRAPDDTPPRRPSAGPWTSHDTDEGDWVVDIPLDGEATVTRLWFGDMETNTGRDISNADLVAAAPDLLEACQAYLAVSSPPWELREMMAAAVSKATGGER